MSGLHFRVQESRLLDCKWHQESVSREACQNWRTNLPPRPSSASFAPTPPVPAPRPPSFASSLQPPWPSSAFSAPPCTLLTTGRLPSILIERSAIPGSRLSLGRPSVSKARLQDMVVSINQGLPSELERELTCPPAPSCTRCPGRPNVLLRAREEDRALPAAEMCC